MLTKLRALKRRLTVRITGKSSLQTKVEASKHGRYVPANPDAPLEVRMGGRPAKPNKLRGKGPKVPVQDWIPHPSPDAAEYLKRRAVPTYETEARATDQEKDD